MIDKKLIPVGGLKKEPFSGCHGGMRYYFQADDSKENFIVTIYPEPWALDKTPEEETTSQSFPLSDEGMDKAIDWLFERYESERPRWQYALKNGMHIAHDLK